MPFSPFRLRPSVVVLLLLSAMQLATSESARACSVEALPFVYALESRFPASISPSPPLKVDGNFVDRLLNSKHQQGFTSVLFYASWCPFSNSIPPTFNALSTMFPRISHAAVEQYSTLPSSAVSIRQFSGLLSLKEMTSSEPYLVFSVLFICLRALLIVLPGLLSYLKGLWISYFPCLRLKIFGETALIWGRIVQVVDVRRIWTKMRLSKVRSFHERARSARVWASSLASVSLGESSLARSSS